METISEIITLGVQNEHDLEHDLVDKALFSTPKIYDADGDLSKRWYIYYSYRHPKTGKLKRMKNIYGKVNRSKTKEARYYLLALYKRRLLLLLKAGYSPFLDNTELYYQHQNHIHKHPQIKTGVVSQGTTETQQTQAFSGVDYQITPKTPPKKRFFNHWKSKG